MRPRSSSMGRNTSASVTVTVLSTKHHSVIYKSVIDVIDMCQETTQLQKRLRLNQPGSDGATDASATNCIDDEQFQKFVSSAR